MLTNLKLIFIHGVSDQSTNYSKALFTGILGACRTQLTAKGMAPLDIDDTLRKVVHHEVLWSDLTTDVTNRYLQLAAPQSRFFWGVLARRIDPLAIQIMQYIKDKGDKPTGAMNILRDVHNDVERILDFTDVGEDVAADTGQNVIFISHSLGSVIAFDYVMGFRKPFKLKRGVTVPSFITMGSPLPLFTTAMGHPDSDLLLPPYVKTWVNIRSPRDGIARPMRPFFRHIPIQEYEVDTHFFPMAAHTGYWRDDQTANLIAFEVIRALGLGETTP